LTSVSGRDFEYDCFIEVEAFWFDLRIVGSKLATDFIEKCGGIMSQRIVFKFFVWKVLKKFPTGEFT
jgi:hypothetical protein